MPVIPQSLDKVFFTQLKGLHNVEISFTDKPITAIFGVNGCGKSTILHALACLYRPNSHTSVNKTTSQDSLNVKMAFHGQEVNYMLIIQ